MTTTHALAGALVGAVATVLVPGGGPTALVVGFVGGALPDADLLWTHRRSLHFPVLAPAVAVPATALAAAVGTPTAALAAVFLLAVAIHALMDVFGGGVETRPWAATSDRGVYDHAAGRWIRPRRWVRYAGAPEDFLLALAVGLPALALATGWYRDLLVAVLACSALFVAVRRRLAGLTERLFADPTE
jgi:hypothetical protein